MQANRFAEKGLAKRKRDDARRFESRLQEEERERRRAKPDAKLVEHERKRKLELRLAELEVRWEDEGVPPEEIAARLKEERERGNAAETQYWTGIVQGKKI